MIRYLSTAAAAALCLVAAAPPADPAAAFGVRQSIESIALSPDGSSIAYVAPAQGQGSGLYTVDLDTGQSRVTTAVDGKAQRLGGCDWVSEVRLVCTIFAVTDKPGELVTVSRLIALDRDGSDVKLLGQKDGLYDRGVSLWGGTVVDWLAGEDGVVLMGQNFVPEQRKNTRLERSEDGYGVVRLDTRSLAAKKVEDPNRQAIQFLSDGRGTIRIMGALPPRGETGMAGEVVQYFYRPVKGGRWQPLVEYNHLTRDGFAPLAVDAERDAVYGLRKLNGRAALYRLALDGSGREELVLAHDEVDVDGVIQIGRNQRVVGATYATEMREGVYFDPEIDKLTKALGKALPGLPLVQVADSSEDGSKLLIFAGSDKDPGRYYIYDKGTRQLAEIMLVRPQLEGVKLAEVKPVRYRAGDGTMIPAYLTLPPGSDGKGLPAIVLPHGGPSARDEWGFDWLAQYYANRGFAVLQPNFRGSTGYGDAWFQENGFQSWRTAVGDVNDAARWLIAEGIAAPDKLASVGWSYGGYAALQANVLDPNLFKATVAIAPVTDLNLLKEEWRNFTNFRNVREVVGSGGHVQEGSPANYPSAFQAPVLLFHGDLDRNVGILQSKRMEDRLKEAGRPVELVVYPGLDHFLDDSQARADMLRRSDAFLRRALGL